MELNLKEKFIPAGTVVLLKGGKKRVMVTGYCVIAPELEGKMFDYCGCVYPEGYINSSQNCLFNHEQIDKIYHVGLVDDEFMKFRKQLIDVLPQINSSIEDINKSLENNDSVPAPAEDITVAPVVKESAIDMSNVASTEVNIEPAAPIKQSVAPAVNNNSVLEPINFVEETK